jgi:hypothetical protein
MNLFVENKLQFAFSIISQLMEVHLSGKSCDYKEHLLGKEGIEV